jgi:hypothetical protein
MEAFIRIDQQISASGKIKITINKRLMKRRYWDDASGIPSQRVLYLATLYGKYTRTLTFENF